MAKKNNDIANKNPDIKVSASVDARCELFESLVIEAFQAEQSACDHPAREARRLGDAPPADAMRAVSEHAERTLETLADFCEQDGLRGRAATTLGSTFSQLRDKLGDMAIDRQRSYRGTLLGLAHCIHLFELMREVVTTGGLESADARQRWLYFINQWLHDRRQLMQAATLALHWFAANPAEAIEPAHAGQFGRAVYRVIDNLRP